MASFLTSSGFLTRLHHDIRFMIYDFLVRDQLIDILSHTRHRTELDSLSLTCKTSRQELRTWYQKNERRLLKHAQWGIFHTPSALFTLNISKNLDAPKPADTQVDDFFTSAVHTFSLKAYSAWRNLALYDNKMGGLLEHLVIDMRPDQSTSTVPTDILASAGFDVILWIGLKMRLFKKLSRCEIVMTSEQNAVRDVNDGLGKLRLTEKIVEMLPYSTCFLDSDECSSNGTLRTLGFRICGSALQSDIVTVQPFPAT
jgi:hypothetical protein